MDNYNWRKESLTESVKWFKKNLRKLAYKTALSSKFESGNLYLYKYDPKLKDVLPYYDTFPIVLVLRLNSKGFIGLNLHYLPPKIRMNFLKKLKSFKNNTGEFLLNYEQLRDFPIFSEYKPCIKQYLYSHIRSTIKPIPPEEWEFVASLSLEHFIKMSKEEVWQESLEKIKED